MKLSWLIGALIALMVGATLVGILLTLNARFSDEQALLSEQLELVDDLLAAQKQLDDELKDATSSRGKNYDELALAETNLLIAQKAIARSSSPRLIAELAPSIERGLALLDDIKIASALATSSKLYFPSAAKEIKDGAIKERLYEAALRVETLEHVVNELLESGADEVIRRAARHALMSVQAAEERDRSIAAYEALDLHTKLSSIRARVSTERDDRGRWVQHTSSGAILLALISLVAAGVMLWNVFQTAGTANRVLPPELVHALGKKSAVDVRPGDKAQKRMHVMFIDMRNYTRQASVSTLEENLVLIDRYTSAIDAHVKQFGGFVIERRGDGAFVLFNAERTDDALRAAVGLPHALQAVNPQLKVGIAINTGEVMLAALGNKRQLSISVTGLPVVIAARIEALTKRCGTTILISEETCRRLKCADDFLLRPLGKWLLNGLDEPVHVHEVFDIDDGAPKEAKRKCLRDHRRAIEYMAQGEFESARALLHRNSESLGSDSVTAILHEQCLRLRDHPESWKGAIQVDVKDSA